MNLSRGLFGGIIYHHFSKRTFVRVKLCFRAIHALTVITGWVKNIPLNAACAAFEDFSCRYYFFGEHTHVADTANDVT